MFTSKIQLICQLTVFFCVNKPLPETLVLVKKNTVGKLTVFIERKTVCHTQTVFFFPKLKLKTQTQLRCINHTNKTELGHVVCMYDAFIAER